MNAQELMEKYNAQSIRMRAIVLMLGIAVVGLLVDQVIVYPTSMAKKQRIQESEQWVQEKTAANQAIFAQQAQETTQTAQSAQLAEIKEKTNDVKNAVILASSSVAPQNIMDAARALLRDYPAIVTKEIALGAAQPLTLGIEPMVLKGEEHVVTVKVEGDYLDLLRYVKMLENQLSTAHWKSMSIVKVPERGVSVLKLVLAQRTFDTSSLERL